MLGIDSRYLTRLNSFYLVLQPQQHGALLFLLVAIQGNTHPIAENRAEILLRASELSQGSAHGALSAVAQGCRRRPRSSECVECEAAEEEEEE
jgi:hypothetical protein